MSLIQEFINAYVNCANWRVLSPHHPKRKQIELRRNRNKQARKSRIKNR